MKYRFGILILFAFVLYGCGNIIPDPQDSSQNESAPAGEVQEITSTGSNSAQNGSDIKVEVVGGDEASLREFIKQWLTPGYPDGSSGDMTVYIGSTPEDIPYDIPVPDDAHTIGSIIGGWYDHMLLFDSSLDATAIREFYSKNLGEKGWQQVPSNAGQGGFVSQSDLYRGYCREEGKAYLSVETPSIPEGKTSIRISLDTSPDPHMCNPEAANTGYSHQDLLPQLKAPEGTLVQGGGAGMSDKDAEISATLESNLSPAELLDFYNQQLTDAGWKIQNSDDGDGGAWSQWALQDDQGKDWLGSLIVVKSSPDSDSLYALLRIERGK